MHAAGRVAGAQEGVGFPSRGVIPGAMSMPALHCCLRAPCRSVVMQALAPATNFGERIHEQIDLARAYNEQHGTTMGSDHAHQGARSLAAADGVSGAEQPTHGERAHAGDTLQGVEDA